MFHVEHLFQNRYPREDGAHFSKAVVWEVMG